MRKPRVCRDEQLRLIQECRMSGMSDHQWCLQHDIRPGTFYNWVSRNKKRDDVYIPSPGGAAEYWPEDRPDIVRIELNQNRSIATVQPAELSEAAVVSPSLSQPNSPGNSLYASLPSAPVLELEMNGTKVKISNDVNPDLLVHVLEFLRGGIC